MGFLKLTRFFLHIKFSRRRLHCTTPERSSNWRDAMKKELETARTTEDRDDCVCIYRVPSNIRQVEPKAYRPNNISIGPYHYGAPYLRNMEMLKRKFFRRLFDANKSCKLDDAFRRMEEVEDKARRCYMDEVKQSRDEFLEMMLVDASFIVQLLRDLSENEFGQVPCVSRWMIPTIRRELIMLENQLPLFVLNELFELMESDQCKRLKLKALALRFFYPLLQVDLDNIPEIIQNESEIEGEHFLDLLRSSIRPNLTAKKPRGTQTHMIRSATELKEAGVKIKADDKRQLLDISFGPKRGLLMKEMTIPSLYINDHRGTVFRNIAAFEKCHKRCNPDVTTYLFFLNGLINSAQDVALLHYKGVVNHSLGDNHVVAELINNISKEMVRDKDESYLHQVVNLANEYFESPYARTRAALVHYYLSSWVVGISSIGAFFALYFTFVQTACGIADTSEVLKKHYFRPFLNDAFLLPILNTVGEKQELTPKVEVVVGESGYDSYWGYFSRDLWDLCMEVCLTE